MIKRWHVFIVWVLSMNLIFMIGEFDYYWWLVTPLVILLCLVVACSIIFINGEPAIDDLNQKLGLKAKHKD